MYRVTILICAALILPAAPANGHGWYPSACCSGQDCRPVEASDIKSTPVGWHVAPTGEVIPYGDRREQFSPDGKFHRCSRHFWDPGALDSTICLFVPNMGS